MAEHRIPAGALEPSPYGETGHWRTPHDTPALRILIAGSAHTPGFIVGYIEATGECRQVHGGPIEPGPYAYAFGASGVISGDGRGTGWEQDQADAGLLIRAEVGDRLVMPDGQTFEIYWAMGCGRPDSHNIELIHVARVDA